MPDFRDSIGALWMQRSRSGADYMSGEITIAGQKYRIVVFANNKRPDKRDPDWRIYPEQGKAQGSSGGGAPSQRQAPDASGEPDWMRDEEQPPFG